MNLKPLEPIGETELRDLSQRLELLSKNLDDVLWIVDAKTGQQRYVSASYGRCWGLDEAELYAGKARWPERIHAADRAAVAASYASLGRGTDRFTVEYRLHLDGGKTRWIRDRGFAVKSDDGTLQQVVGIAEDITDRRERERELRTITAAIPIGIARLDRELRYQFVNEAYASLVLGSTPDQIVGRRLPDLIDKSAMTAAMPFLDQALEGRQVEFEAQLALPGGDSHLRTSLIPEFSEAQEITGVVVLKENISERKEAETRLYEREREFKTLAENAPDVIARVDRRLAYLYVNAAAERAFGVVRDAYIGRDAMALGFPIAYIEATAAAALGAFDSAAEQATDFSVGRGSACRHFIARAVPEFDRGGLVESVLLIIYDVSERVRAQVERDCLLLAERQAREQAEAAARGRDEFLAIVSHELRSPLNGIQSWTQLLQKTLPDASPTTRRALAGIRTGVDQQVRLINDLLDATRIISGKLSLNFAAVKLLPVLAMALRSVRGPADEKQVTLMQELALDGDETVDGDTDRLQQIVWNLLGNAVKFTASGGHVWLKAWATLESLIIEVRDDGRGIDPSFLPRLFERFQRDETDNSRDQDGLGLGLMLVRHLCTLHGGTVTASSAGPGTGATFTVQLPRRMTAALQTPRSSPATILTTADTLRKIQVLLVDDHVESRDALAALLGQAGASVRALGSGDEAIQLLQVEPARADVLICDIAMPDKDGYQTLREIRLNERQRGAARLPAIALTAFVQNDDRQRALAAGFDVHMAKPVDVDALIQRVATIATTIDRSGAKAGTPHA